MSEPNEDNPDMLAGKRPRWAIVTNSSDSSDVLDIRWLGRPVLDADERVIIGLLSQKWDDFDVVPPEDWPDHVCTKVMKYNLTGEADDGYDSIA
jgi:hypothetical protein